VEAAENYLLLVASRQTLRRSDSGYPKALDELSSLGTARPVGFASRLRIEFRKFGLDRSISLPTNINFRTWSGLVRAD
jgi:hypothetical protein